MPFMKGLSPIRRTIKYLESSNLVLKERVKVFALHYNIYPGVGSNHDGAKEFAFWNMPQVQYKNPDVQVVSFKNVTPTPFIRMFCEDGEDILVDVDNKSRTEIISHIKKIICKSDEVLAKEALENQSLNNPANFGWGCDRQCICEIPGQVPCPGVVPLPKSMRGKYKYGEVFD